MSAEPRGALEALVRRLDARLRRRQGIYEFTQHPECIFRIAVVTAGDERMLSDGTRVLPDDRVVELHLWNEHIPRVSRRGADLAWAARVRSRTERSLHLLAAHLESSAELAGIAALHGRMVFPGGTLVLAKQFGFDVVSPRRERWYEGLHELGAKLLVWGLVWSFNPGALKGGLGGRFRELWMSRARLQGRFGAGETAGSGGD